MRTCTECNQRMCLEEFVRRGNGFRHTCKPCYAAIQRLRRKQKTYDFKSYSRKCNEKNKEHRLAYGKKYYDANKDKWRYKCWASKLKRLFGITPEDYNRMFQEQNGCCAICHKPESIVKSGVISRLAVDHCHSTNKLRMLLCQRCNTTIGRCEESVELLQKMINYLQQFSV